METRANYVLIGAFTLLGFLGLIAFFLWFARVELDRQFAYYDIGFPSVSGLSNGSDVRFSGLLVGRVVDVGLSDELDGSVSVRIEVNADTPVRTSTVARVESQGVTGVSFIGLSAGDPDDPLLLAVAEDPIPTIRSGQSAFQSLTEDAPEILEELLALTRQVSEFLGTENQERVAGILVNLESATGNFDSALADFSQVTEAVSNATADIAAFTSRLDEISAATVRTLETADGTLQSVTAVAGRVDVALDTVEATLESGRRTLDTAEAFIWEDLPGLVEELTGTAETLRAEIAALGTDTRSVLDEFRATGTLANDRLRQAEATLGNVDTMLADMSAAMDEVETTAEQFTAFLTGDGTALVNETRALIADAGRVAASAADLAETELPLILSDIRAATDTAARTIESVGGDLSAAAGRADGLAEDISTTFRTVGDTFEAANGTLERLNAALETGESALASADRAFASADRVLTDEAGAITAGLQDTLDRLNAAIAQVSEDIPEITGDLRAAAASATDAFGEVEDTVGALGPSLRGFAADGLPQYARLAAEARTLVQNLEQLVRAIERDPARYFLGGEAPVFRR